MSVHLDKAGWEANFKGWVIVDCATRGDGMISLCARKVIPHEKTSSMWDHDIPTRLVNIDLKNPGADNWGHQEVEGFKMPVLGVSRAPFPVPQGLIAAKNMNDDVLPRGSGVTGPIEFIHVGGDPFPNRLKCINGYTWCVSSSRQIYKRVAVGKWVPMNQGFPDVPRSASLGFDDMDAFAEMLCTPLVATAMFSISMVLCGDRWVSQAICNQARLPALAMVRLISAAKVATCGQAVNQPGKKSIRVVQVSSGMMRSGLTANFGFPQITNSRYGMAKRWKASAMLASQYL